MGEENWRSRLRLALGDSVSFDVPMAPRVSFRIGGPADAFVRPKTSAELIHVLRIAREGRVPITILGTGSNVLVSDRGIRGIVLRFAGTLADVSLGPSTHDDRWTVEVGAGALNAKLVSLLLKSDLVGLEFLATIPGTFGGALIMNAGAHGGEIASYVDAVTLVLPDLTEEIRSGGACGFAYRTSGFAPGEIILGARLVVPKGDALVARAHLAKMRAHRKATQPPDLPNAGSIFKNPPGDYAGRLIEAAGLKGRTRGRAQISTQHANFIVNLGEATALDVACLAEEARAEVLRQFGVDLGWEVRRIGEWDGGCGTPPG